MKLGDYYYNVGNMGEAAKCYSRTRDYCTSSKSIMDMCFNMIKVRKKQNNNNNNNGYADSIIIDSRFDATVDPSGRSSLCARPYLCLTSRVYTSNTRQNKHHVKIELLSSYLRILHQ